MKRSCRYIFKKKSYFISVIHDILVWMEKKFWELIRWADSNISKGLEWVEDNYPIVTHTPNEIYANAHLKVEEILDWIQSFWVFNNAIFRYVRKAFGFGEYRPHVQQAEAAQPMVNGGGGAHED